MTLDRINAGETVRITAIDGSGLLRRRLLDMGLTPRTVVQVTKLAPLGDPMVLSLRGYELSIRKEDASRVRVDGSAERGGGNRDD